MSKNLAPMLQQIVHRGPDDYGATLHGFGTEQNDAKWHYSPAEIANASIALGHRRLSILDLSEHGRQPMLNADNQTEIVFNGEIYNYIELREELKQSHGFQFKTGSDTEVLLRCYQVWGMDMLPRLDGMFSFVLLDKAKGELYAARDMAGIKPFYYFFSDNILVFGSEPKALHTFPGITKQFDATRLAEFLLMGVCDFDEGSFFNEIKQLQPAHFLKYNLKNFELSTKRYWNFPTNTSTFSDYPAKFFELATTAVSRQLRSDVPVGTSLSGGIDSGAIAVLAGKQLGEKAKNYNALTFSFPGFPNDESGMARDIATSAGLAWHEIIPSLDTIESDLERMISNMGEPFGTLSMFAQYKVMEKARQLGIKVMLDGQGGDELYLGYPRLAQRTMMQYLGGGNIPKFFKEWTGLKKNLSIPLHTSLLGNLYFNSGTVALGRKRPMVAKYVKGELLELVRKDLIEDFFAPKSLLAKQQDEFGKYVLPRLLKYADRNSMAFSVESRVPHLSVPMLEFAFSLPLAWKVNSGWTKYVVRKGMSGHLPDHILWSNVKRGFDIPQSFWIEKMKPTLKTWVNEAPDDIPFHKQEILKALDQKPGDKHLWPVISTLALNRLLNTKF